MFKKKTKICITVWNEDAVMWIAKQLSDLHINYTWEQDVKFSVYHMKVSDKQLSGIIRYIVPRKNYTNVMMILDTGVTVTLTI